MIFNKIRHQNTGNMMVSMSIALTIAAILSIASAKYAINKFNEDKGTLVGNQLQTVINAVNAYITDHTDEISNKPMIVNDIVGYSNKFKPTASELKNAGYLGSDFSTTPILGGSYTIEIKQLASSCQLNCLIGSVYLINPIGVVNNNAVDIKILGAAVAASKTGQIGYSTPGNKNFISGPWASTSTILNPDQSKRAGILYATTSVLSNTEKHWLPPFSTLSNSPRKGNITGDVRIALDTKKPFAWDESDKDWLELFSSDQTLYTVSIGRDSGSINSLKNTFLGYHAGQKTFEKSENSDGGQQNTMIGSSSGTFNTMGSNNVFLGHAAGNKNESGNENIFIGSYAGNLNTTQSNNIIIGTRTPYTTSEIKPNLSQSTDNIHIGKDSGRTSSGKSNIFLGKNSGKFTKNNTTDSIFIGNDAGYSSGYSETSTENSKNIFLGNKSGYASEGISNIYIGENSGGASSGNYNIFLGSNTAQNNKGNENLFSGYNSGFRNTEGSRNTFTGSYSGYSISGNDNTAIGANAGAGIESNPILISKITAIGASAFTKANNSTSIGASSFVLSENSISIGADSKIFSRSKNSIALGNEAAVAPDSVNSMAIGFGAQVSGSNSVRIGNSDVENISIGKANLTTTGNITAKNITATTVTATTVNSSSDKRLKTDITDTPRDLSFIKKLRPVDYTLISNGQPQTGFIAQEVESADPDFPGIVKPQNDRDFYALTYTAFIPAIVKSIQQLDARLEKIAPATLATSATAPASVSGPANGAAPAPASADLSLLKWLVLFLSVCVLSCLAVIVRFYKELQAMRLSVQRLHALAA